MFYHNKGEKKRKYLKADIQAMKILFISQVPNSG